MDKAKKKLSFEVGALALAPGSLTKKLMGKSVITTYMYTLCKQVNIT